MCDYYANCLSACKSLISSYLHAFKTASPELVRLELDKTMM